MKYKLLKQIEEKDSIKVGSIFDIGDHRTTLDIDIPECQVPISFLISQGYIEEIKEPKTIYDLKEGDRYWYLCSMNSVWKQNCMSGIKDDYKTSIFLTEREAKRNKLLRDLATRTSKHLPKKGENYICSTGISRIWQDLDYQILDYNIGLVFYGDDDYNSFMTDENKKLLFEI